MAGIILNAAYIALLGSTFARSVNWLRALLITGSLALVVYAIVEDISR